MSAYIWSTFDLDASLNGLLVGIQSIGANEDISLTGRLESNSSDPGLPYLVSLNGTLCYCNSAGITYCPTDVSLNNKQLKNVKVVLDQATTNVITRSEGGQTVTRTISSANPRDEFAMEILNAIIQKQDNPQTFDDGSMLRTAQLAYRWANAMMEAAAANRYNDADAPAQGGSTDDVANVIKTMGTTTSPLVTAVKNLNNTQLVVKGNSTYNGDTGVLKVDVVGGGGGGADLTTLNKAVDTSTVGSEHFRVGLNIGQDPAHPLYISSSNNSGVEIVTGSTFPSASDVEKEHYYLVTGTQSAVALNLPAVSSSPLVAGIVLFHFECSANAAFSITVPSGTTVKYRGSNPGATLSAGTYEIDCLDNGLYWIVGVTEIVSS